MTDYFALLEQPQRAWLDLEKLKQAFHEKSRQAHPDAGGSGTVFAQINEAYQVLQDPKRRLHHLLSLEGRSPAAAAAVPQEISDAFQTVAVATQAADAARQKFAAANSALSQSLLKAELAQARAGIDEALEKLRGLQSKADGELRELNDVATDAPDRVARLENLYARYAYLTRWIGQLEERQAQLQG